MSDYKNIFSIIQTKLQSVSVAVKHLELHGESAELEEFLKKLEGMNTAIKRRLDALSNLDTRSSEKSAIACPTFKRTRSTKYALIGPQGIGKSKHSSSLAAALGVTIIFDDGHGCPKNIIREDTLLISNDPQCIDQDTLAFFVQDESDILELIKSLQPSIA